jgi:putative phosphoribosyl transferase
MENGFHKVVDIPVEGVLLQGELVIPQRADAVVIFSHGSGSSRFSPRNQQVARYLREKSFGTLLFDLLTREEDRNYHNRFNIDLLTTRLVRVTDWLYKLPEAGSCRLGYFGASTGAASALRAASLSGEIDAVVSRGGRPDLAMDVLHRVHAPTLLIVGSLDHDVLDLNRKAYRNLAGQKELAIVPGASHLFEEAGSMEKVCELASGWFKKYLHTEKRNEYVRRSG